ncbi:hypothetical protein QW131_30225 [Roseibium salinum]|nr:hypothetical protein [Roseibium salinum]
MAQPAFCTTGGKARDYLEFASLLYVLSMSLSMLFSSLRERAWRAENDVGLKKAFPLLNRQFVAAFRCDQAVPGGIGAHHHHLEACGVVGEVLLPAGSFPGALDQGVK